MPAAGDAVLGVLLALVVVTMKRVVLPPHPAIVDTQAASAATTTKAPPSGAADHRINRRMAPDVSGGEGRSPHFWSRLSIAAFCGKRGPRRAAANIRVGFAADIFPRRRIRGPRSLAERGTQKSPGLIQR